MLLVYITLLATFLHSCLAADPHKPSSAEDDDLMVPQPWLHSPHADQRRPALRSGSRPGSRPGSRSGPFSSSLRQMFSEAPTTAAPDSDIRTMARHAPAAEASSGGPAGGMRDQGMCEEVCHVCRQVISIRWAALCLLECRLGGRSYDACLTVWAFKHDIGLSRVTLS